MNQLAKEYIENYLTFASKLAQKSAEFADKGSVVPSLSNQAISAAQTAIPMLEILSLEDKSKSQ